jgi:hypothetical protein
LAVEIETIGGIEFNLYDRFRYSHESQNITRQRKDERFSSAAIAACEGLTPQFDNKARLKKAKNYVSKYSFISEKCFFLDGSLTEVSLNLPADNILDTPLSPYYLSTAHYCFDFIVLDFLIVRSFVVVVDSGRKSLRFLYFIQ